MSNAIESGIGTLNYGKQSAKGTPAVAAETTSTFAKLKLYDGALMPKQTEGDEEYVDGQRWASPSEYIDTVGGLVGTLTIQAQPTSAPLMWAQLLGTDTVTGSGDPYTHTITSAGTSGAWGTWWQKVGANVGPERALYSDSKQVKIVQTASDKQKVMHMAIDVASCNPSQVYVTDPAKTEDTSDPYYWYESAGAVTFDATVLAEVNEEIVEADSGIKPFWGNAQAPALLIEGKGTIVRTLKAVVTDVTLAKMRKVIYGTTTPAEGEKPTKGIYYASASTVYEKTATRKMTITTPRIAVKPDEMGFGPQREGGEIPVTFGGKCLKEGATAALTIVALSADKEPYS